MDKELFDYVAQRADVLSVSNASKQATKDAALAWKEAVSADASDAAIDEATARFVDFLEGRPKTIDAVIAFAQGAAVKKFGPERATEMLEANLQRKAQGAKYCGCEACTAASEILMKFCRA